MRKVGNRTILFFGYFKIFFLLPALFNLPGQLLIASLQLTGPFPYKHFKFIP